MDVDGAVEDLVVAVADFVEEGFAGAHASAGTGEAGEEIELDRRERERLIGEQCEAGFGADAERADDKFGEGGGRGGCGPIDRSASGATKDGAEAGEELAGGKGFREVVVGADFEADDAVGFVAARGEHEDGHVAGAAYPAKHFKAIEAGKHDIEDDGLPRSAGGGGEGGTGGTVVFGGDVEAEGREVIADKAAEFAVVVDHEEADAAGRGVVVNGVHGAERNGFRGGKQAALRGLNNFAGAAGGELRAKRS